MPQIWTSNANTFQLSNQVSVLEGKYVRTTRFATIGSGTGGSVTLPPSATVVLDDFGGVVDAVVSNMSAGRPTFTGATDASGNPIATSFDSAGNYSFIGTPYSYPVAIIYRVRQTLVNFDSTSSDIVGAPHNITGEPGIEDSFETFSKNLRCFPALLIYSGDTLTSIEYTVPAGEIVKNLGYSGGKLQTIVFTGDIPSGIFTTKTLTYTGDLLTGIVYS